MSNNSLDDKILKKYHKNIVKRNDKLTFIKYLSMSIYKELYKDKLNIIKNNSFNKNIITKNLIKYNSSPKIKNIMIINDLIFAKSNKITSIFKDYLIINYNEEFLKRFYNHQEIKEKIPKFYQYYKNYLSFFCKATFKDFHYNHLIQNYGEIKAEIYYNSKYGNDKKKKDIMKNKNDKNNKNKKIDKKSNAIIFSPSLRKSLEKINISKTNDIHVNGDKDFDLQKNSTQKSEINYSNIEKISRENSSISILNLLNEYERNKLKNESSKVNTYTYEKNENIFKDKTINNKKISKNNSYNNKYMKTSNHFYSKEKNKNKDKNKMNIYKSKNKKHSINIINNKVSEFNNILSTLNPNYYNKNLAKTGNNFYSNYNIFKTETLFHKNINEKNTNNIYKPFLQLKTLSNNLSPNKKDQILHYKNNNFQYKYILSFKKKNNKFFKSVGSLKKFKFNLNIDNNNIILPIEKEKKNKNIEEALKTSSNAFTPTNKNIIIKNNIYSLSESNIKKNKNFINKNSIHKNGINKNCINIINNTNKNVNINEKNLEAKLSQKEIKYLNTINKSRNNQKNLDDIKTKIINTYNYNNYINFHPYKTLANTNTNYYLAKSNENEVFETIETIENIKTLNHYNKKWNNFTLNNQKYSNKLNNIMNSNILKSNLGDFKTGSKLRIINKK